MSESEARYRTLFDGINNGVAVYEVIDNGKDFIFKDFNRAGEKIDHDQRERLIGKSIFEVRPGVEQFGLIDVFRKVWRTGEPAYHPVTLYQDERLTGWYENYVYKLPSGEIVAIFEDITERKKIEESLLERQEMFRELAETVHEVFWIQDYKTGRLLYISPTYEDIWGHSSEGIYQMEYFFIDSIHPDDYERMQKAFEAQRNGEVFDEDFRIISSDGTVRWMSSKSYIARNAEGEIYRIFGILEDISERQQMETQILRTQRLESIGLLAGGIAHDLNNVLSPIMMSIQLLQRRLIDAENLGILSTIEAAAMRGADIVRQILSFARGSEKNFILTQPRYLLKEVQQIINETFPKSIVLKSNIAHDLSPIPCNITQFHQAIMNLCVNARDAMQEEGTLELQAENIFLEENDVRLYPNVKPGPFVVVRVSDDGPGIPVEYLENIFNPFFTTKERGKGTGLGLLSVHTILTSHGGFIKVDTELEKGTTFSLYFPSSPGSVVKKAEQRKGDLPRGDGELILIIDDEVSIRDMAKRVLEMHGYETLEAVDGADGFTKFLDNASRIRLVICDLMMPVLDGAATMAGLKKISSTVKILAMSGVVLKGNQQEEWREIVDGFLAKPFNAEQMLTTIDNILKSS